MDSKNNIKKYRLVEKNVSVVVLAAGNSARMSYPKPFLKWNQTDTFINKIINTYINFNCKPIVVVFNSNVLKTFISLYPNLVNNINLNIVINDFYQYERFYSLKKGLLNCLHSNYCFIQNIDNPFVNYTLLDLIYQNIDKSDYLVPTHKEKGGHPILINKEIIHSIANSPENNNNLNVFLKQYRRKNIAVDDKSILNNINTPQDYDLLIKCNKNLIDFN